VLVNVANFQDKKVQLKSSFLKSRDNMLSQSTGINFLLSGVLAAVISGVILTINNFWISSSNNKFQLEKEKQQRIWQEESDHKKWYREKIYDYYKKSIQILTKMMQEDAEIGFYVDMGYSDKISISKSLNVAKLNQELLAELVIIKAGHSDKDSKEFTDQLYKIEALIDMKEFMQAQNIIAEMMENDSRIKNISK